MTLNDRHKVAHYKSDDLLEDGLLAFNIGIEPVDEILAGVLRYGSSYGNAGDAIVGGLVEFERAW